jgi:hypothetical protein
MKVLTPFDVDGFSVVRKKVSRWNPAGNGTAITADGALGIAVSGTATAANVAATNTHTALRRIDYLVTAPATNAVAGFRISAGNQFWRGNVAGLGGFNYLCQWGPSEGVATSTTRAFVGMSALTAGPTDVEPSSLVTMIGMGWDAADTNIQLMRNDGTGTATKIDLGANFPVPTADRTEAYELRLYCEPNGSSIDWQVTDLGTNDVASGSVSTDIPAGTSFLSPRGWMSVGGTSSVIGIALMNMWIETDK